MVRKLQRNDGILGELQLAEVQPPGEAVEQEAKGGEPVQDDATPAQEEAKEEEVTEETAPATVEGEVSEETEAEGESHPERPSAPVDPARFAAMEQSLQEEQTARKRERTAMLREIQKLRARQAAPQPHQPPQPPPRIPVEFDEAGQPYVSPENLARVIQQVAPTQTNPVTQFGQQHQRMAESVVLTNPVDYSKANTRYREAYASLDEAVRFAQLESNAETTDMDSMMALIEDSGVAEAFMKEYPDIAGTPRDIEDFLQSSISLNPRRYQRVLDRIATHGSEEPEGRPTPAQKPNKGISAMAERMGRKPVPLRKMGSSPQPVKAKSRVAALSEKSPFDWTEDDRKQFLKEMETVDNQGT